MSELSISDLLEELIALWHDVEGIEGVEVYQFLGMTWDEYGAWVTHGNGSPTPERLHGYWRWLRKTALRRYRYVEGTDHGTFWVERTAAFEQHLPTPLPPCPECDSPVVDGDNNSGVKCANPDCDWWYCA